MYTSISCIVSREGKGEIFFEGRQVNSFPTAYSIFLRIDPMNTVRSMSDNIMSESPPSVYDSGDFADYYRSLSDNRSPTAFICDGFEKIRRSSLFITVA